MPPRKLLPPKNVRTTDPHVCGSCKHLLQLDRWCDCERGAVSFVTGDGKEWFTTCDRWTHPNPPNGRQIAHD